jgi:hypothetical protein
MKKGMPTHRKVKARVGVLKFSLRRLLVPDSLTVSLLYMAKPVDNFRAGEAMSLRL